MECGARGESRGGGENQRKSVTNIDGLESRCRFEEIYISILVCFLQPLRCHSRMECKVHHERFYYAFCLLLRRILKQPQPYIVRCWNVNSHFTTSCANNCRKTALVWYWFGICSWMKCGRIWWSCETFKVFSESKFSKVTGSIPGPAIRRSSSTLTFFFFKNYLDTTFFILNL